MFTGGHRELPLHGHENIFPVHHRVAPKAMKACLLDISLTYCCYVQASVCVCVKGCSSQESCQLSETTVGG